MPAKLRYLFATDQTAFEWSRSKKFRPSPLFDRAYEYSRFYYIGLWLLAVAGSAILMLRGRKPWQQSTVITRHFVQTVQAFYAQRAAASGVSGAKTGAVERMARDVLIDAS